MGVRVAHASRVRQAREQLHAHFIAQGIHQHIGDRPRVKGRAYMAIERIRLRVERCELETDFLDGGDEARVQRLGRRSMDLACPMQ